MSDQGPRFFSEREREALFVGAGGLCTECGRPLPANWHGDHVTAYSRGGPTDVINGQALCPECNLRKGNRVSVLRPWQEQALLEIRTTTSRDFLLVATPGAGKTRLALTEAHRRFENGTINRLVIICPTAHLVLQWIRAAHDLGIDLSSQWPPDAEMQGVVVTYQQVTHHETLHRFHCGQPTMVIFDEIHHAGHERAWGAAILEAFAPATFRLALSGTPFRSDGTRIPFITYVNDQAQADHTYTYGEALDDNVCRPVFFPRYGGRAEWMWAGEIESATFDDNVDEVTSSRRLRTVLTSGDWLPTVLGDADVELFRMRAEHASAGGLVVAMDQGHAEWIAGIMTRRFGTRPVVAVSDDPDASSKIDRFAKGTDPWLVAVRMVSEGVDIPRLRVAVYATNVTAELFFRQAVGRVVRVLDDIEDNTAAFFIPDDPLLKEHAELIKVERERHLDQAMAEPAEPRSPTESMPGLFTPLDSSGVSTGVIYDGNGIGPDELRRAARLAEQAGLKAHPAQVAQLLRLADSQPSSIVTAPPTVRPKADRKKALRQQNSKQVTRLAYRTEREPKDVNREANEAVGIWKISEATEDQLVARLAYLQELMGKAP